MWSSVTARYLLAAASQAAVHAARPNQVSAQTALWSSLEGPTHVPAPPTRRGIPRTQKDAESAARRVGGQLPAGPLEGA